MAYGLEDVLVVRCLYDGFDLIPNAFGLILIRLNDKSDLGDLVLVGSRSGLHINGLDFAGQIRSIDRFNLMDLFQWYPGI